MPGYLTLLVLLPVVAMGLIALLPPDQSRMARWIAAFSGVGAVAVASLAALGMDPAAGMQLADTIDWLPGQGIRYQVGADSYGMCLLWIASLVGLASTLASWGIEARARLYFCLLLAMQAALSLAFAAQDLFLFLVAWQLALLLSYFLTCGWGEARRAYAGMKAWLMVGTGQALTLGSGVALYMLNGSNADLTVMLTSHPAAVAPMSLQIPLFLTFAAGFVVQAPLFPFHTWQADQAGEAPLPVTLLATGLLGTLAGYALMRLGFGILPGPARELSPLLTGLGLVSALYAAWGAIVQADLRRTIAFLSMGMLGLTVVGMATFQAAGLKGASFALLAHASLLPLLYLVSDALFRRGTSWQLPEMESLTRLLPRLRLAVIVTCTLALVLPYFAGFPRAALVPGILASQPAVGGVSLLAWAGLAWAVLSVGRSLVLGLASPQFKGLPDLGKAEALPLGLLGLVALALAIFPLAALEAVDAFARFWLPLIGL